MKENLQLPVAIFCLNFMFGAALIKAGFVQRNEVHVGHFP